MHEIICQNIPKLLFSNFKNPKKSINTNPHPNKRKSVQFINQSKSKDINERSINLRSEVEAPFRIFRLVIYGFSATSTFLGLLINLTQIIGASLGNTNGPTLEEAYKNIGIDIIGILIFGYLFYNDYQNRTKQLRRLKREQKLGNLKIELADKRILSLNELRGAARVVVIAGNRTYLESAMIGALEFRKHLTAAGVFIVQFPVHDNNEESVLILKDDIRWTGNAVRIEEWEKWFLDQLKETKNEVTFENGLFIGLRLDGRIRASGQGIPPWRRFAYELPPQEGIWKGFGDGFDGPVY